MQSCIVQLQSTAFSVPIALVWAQPEIFLDSDQSRLSPVLLWTHFPSTFLRFQNYRNIELSSSLFYCANLNNEIAPHCPARSGTPFSKESKDIQNLYSVFLLPYYKQHYSSPWSFTPSFIQSWGHGWFWRPTLNQTRLLQKLDSHRLVLLPSLILHTKLLGPSDSSVKQPRKYYNLVYERSKFWRKVRFINFSSLLTQEKNTVI